MPIQPPIPNTVMKKRFLYRTKLRTVDFHVKFRFFQINGTRSRNTRFPCFGVGGRINSAACSRNSFIQENSVAITVHASAAAHAATA